METFLVIGAAATATLAVAGVLRVLFRVWRRVDDFLREWNGEPARRGHEARPSMSERVGRLEDQVQCITEQVTPNGGNTAALGDRIVRIEKHLGVGVD